MLEEAQALPWTYTKHLKISCDASRGSTSACLLSCFPPVCCSFCEIGTIAAPAVC